LLETCSYLNLGQPKKRKEVIDLSQQMVLLSSWNYIGLSGRDSWKKHVENEGIEGNVQAMESNEGRDRKMVENKGN
jgi:hypothetical protein